MTKLDEIRESVAALGPAEKAALFQDLAVELTNGFPGIERTPGVSGGDACIIRTRIPVWLVESLRRQGATDTQLLEAYPQLHAQDLVNARAYVNAHRDEIDRQIAEQEAA
jgi:uncharacterized protein (DUF433 family)